jgi:formate dehydrogenase iron-sulfur subunit
MSGRNISRRDFLKTVGVGGAAATAAWLLEGSVGPVYASEGGAASAWGMLIDLTRCTGCNSCALACKESNDLALPYPGAVPDGLNSDTYTFVEEHWVTTETGDVKQRFVKRQCMHCLNAACVSACPAAAMHKGEGGAVIYRSSRCLGCRYCEAACPFSVPRVNWDNGITPVINKCWLCYDRVREEGEPACAGACPTGALHFGRREELLLDAHAKIATNPDRYIDHIFGESEVGGTAMLYLSDVPFEQLGFRTDLPTTAPPEQTEKIVTKLPFVLTGMTAFLTGAAVYTHRKPAELASEGKERQSASPSLPSAGEEE